MFGLLEHLYVWFAGVCFAFVLGFDFSANDVMGFIFDTLYFFFFWLRIHGLAMSELPVIYWARRGLGFVIYIYIYIFFFFKF